MENIKINISAEKLASAINKSLIHGFFRNLDKIIAESEKEKEQKVITHKK